VHFFGVLGYNARTKRWREPNTYTPILAGVQFCMRVLMLEYALPSEDRNELICMEGDDPLEIFRGVRDKWLVDGEASPFNAMHKLLQYGMRAENVIGRAVRLSRARADRDFTESVCLGPKELDLTSIPGRYQSEVFKMSVRPV
jgi:hypothetical protein